MALRLDQVGRCKDFYVSSCWIVCGEKTNATVGVYEEVIISKIVERTTCPCVKKDDLDCGDIEEAEKVFEDTSDGFRLMRANLVITEPMVIEPLDCKVFVVGYFIDTEEDGFALFNDIEAKAIIKSGSCIKLKGPVEKATFNGKNADAIRVTQYSVVKCPSGEPEWKPKVSMTIKVLKTSCSSKMVYVEDECENKWLLRFKNQRECEKFKEDTRWIVNGEYIKMRDGAYLGFGVVSYKEKTDTPEGSKSNWMNIQISSLDCSNRIANAIDDSGAKWQLYFSSFSICRDKMKKGSCWRVKDIVDKGENGAKKLYVEEFESTKCDNPYNRYDFCAIVLTKFCTDNSSGTYYVKVRDCLGDEVNLTSYRRDVCSNVIIGKSYKFRLRVMGVESDGSEILEIVSYVENANVIENVI